jgi:hypothetical protein
MPRERRRRWLRIAHRLGGQRHMAKIGRKGSRSLGFNRRGTRAGSRGSSSSRKPSRSSSTRSTKRRRRSATGSEQRSTSSTRSRRQTCGRVVRAPERPTRLQPRRFRGRFSWAWDFDSLLLFGGRERGPRAAGRLGNQLGTRASDLRSSVGRKEPGRFADALFALVRSGSAPAVPAHPGKHLCSVVDATHCLS